MSAPHRSPTEIDAMIPKAEPDWVMDAPPMNGGAKPVPIASRRPVASGLSALSWADLLAEPDEPPPMLARGIPKVGLTVLAGPPKVGKTLYASQVAMESAQAVLIILEEGSRSGVSFRLRKQAAGLGIIEPAVTILLRQHIRLDDRSSVSRLRDEVARIRPALVLCDPLNRLHNGDENRPSQMTPVMDALAGIAYDFDCAVVANHHLAKPSAERRGDIWDRFRGATSIRSGTDANLIMDGSGAIVRLYGEFRDAEPMSMYIELDRETLLFHDADGPKSQTKIDPDELRAYLQETGQATARDVQTRFGVKSKETARAALESIDGIDWFEGLRNQRTYTLGTAQ